MSKDDILTRVTEVLVRSFELEPDEVHPTAHLFDDLDLDSIDAIDLVVGVEESTGLKVVEEELAQIRVVQDVVDLVYRKLGDG
jgi:acyl carrier protein